MAAIVGILKRGIGWIGDNILGNVVTNWITDRAKSEKQERARHEREAQAIRSPLEMFMARINEDEDNPSRLSAILYELNRYKFLWKERLERVFYAHFYEIFFTDVPVDEVKEDDKKPPVGFNIVDLIGGTTKDKKKPTKGKKTAWKIIEEKEEEIIKELLRWNRLAVREHAARAANSKNEHDYALTAQVDRLEQRPIISQALDSLGRMDIDTKAVKEWHEKQKKKLEDKATAVEGLNNFAFWAALIFGILIFATVSVAVFLQ